MKVKEMIQKIAFGAKKHKSEIFFITGIAAIVGGTVLCCKETLKTPDILEEHKKQRAEIKAKSEEYPDYKEGKDLFHLYLKTTGKLLWNYKWGIGLEALGIGLTCKGYSDKSAECASAMAGLSAVSTAFDEYRNRVREEDGEAKDRHYLTGESEMEFTDIPAEDELDENGKKKKVSKKKLTVGDPDTKGDGYGIYISPGNPLYDKEDDYFLMNIRRIQNNLNDKKQASLTNSICLNDIYESLYAEKCKKGMIAGYIGDHHFIEFDVKKVNLPDQFGEFHEAYWIGFKNLKKNIYDEMEV